MKSRLEGWNSSSGTLEESCAVCVHRMIRRGEDVPIGRSGECQRRVTKYWSQDLKLPDDTVHDGVGRSGVIGGVSQRGVSSKLAQATLVGSSGVGATHASVCPVYASELQDTLEQGGDTLWMVRRCRRMMSRKAHRTFRWWG